MRREPHKLFELFQTGITEKMHKECMADENVGIEAYYKWVLGEVEKDPYADLEP